jgi:hypothetical protein
MADTDLPNGFGAINRPSHSGMAPADWWRFLPPFAVPPQGAAAPGGWEPAPLPMVSQRGWEPAPVPMVPNPPPVTWGRMDPNADTSAAAGRAILERTDPRFAPPASPVAWGNMDPHAPPADNDSWWKMAPNAPASAQRKGAFDDLIPPANQRGPWDDYAPQAAQGNGPWNDYAKPAPTPNYFDRFDPKPDPANATNSGGASMAVPISTRNLDRIQDNVRSMIKQGAPASDIDAYLKSEGQTPESFAKSNSMNGNAFEDLIPPRTPLHTATRIGTAGAQGINRGLYSAAMALPDLSAVIARSLGLVSPAAPLPSERLSPNGTRFDIKPETTAERVVNDVGNAAGQVAGTVLPAGAIARGITPAVNGMRVAATPTLGQGIAETLAAQPGMQLAANAAGNVTSDLTGNPYLGLAASLAVPFGANAGLRIPFSAPATTGAEAERRALLADAKKEGILPSFGNVVDSGPARMFESVVSKLPFMGNAQAKLVENNKTGFNVAALDKIPAVRGEGLDAATPGTVDMIKARVGKQFNALENNTTVNIDPQVGTDIAKAKADFSKQLESQMPPSITKQLDELATAPAAGSEAKPQIDGETYKNIRSKLSAMLGSTSGPDRQAVGAMIDALDGAVQRSLPKDMVQDWKDARQSWRRISMIDDAVSARHNGETAVGNIPPGSLDARAGSDRDMARLGQIGTKYVGDKTPDSGTAMRTLIHNAMGLGAGAGGAYAFPMTTAALAGGGYAANLMMNNPYTRAALINRLQRSRQGVVDRGLVATLAGQRAENSGQ